MLYASSDEVVERPSRPRMTRRRKVTVWAVAVAVALLGVLILQHQTEQANRAKVEQVEQARQDLTDCARMSELAAIRAGKCGY